MSELKNYPQMPPLTGEEVNSFLKEPRVAVISTHNDDGSIHSAPVWYKFVPETNEILFGTQDVSKKIRNIKKDSTISVYVGKDQMPAKAVLIYGTATLDYDNVVEKRIEIFSNYVPRESAQMYAESAARNHLPVIVRIKINDIISFDYSK